MSNLYTKPTEEVEQAVLRSISDAGQHHGRPLTRAERETIRREVLERKGLREPCWACGR